MMLRHLAAASALALAALVPAAQAASLPADGSWATVLMDNYRPPYTSDWLVDDDGAIGTSVSFNVAIAVGFQGTLTVVDTDFAGDRFSVSDNGTLLGQTGAAVADMDLVRYAANPDAAFGNSDYSRGVFTLGAGNHVITGAWVESPYGATHGAIKLDVSPVPEPATVATLLAGLSLLTVAIRRRNGSK